MKLEIVRQKNVHFNNVRNNRKFNKKYIYKSVVYNKNYLLFILKKKLIDEKADFNHLHYDLQWPWVLCTKFASS